MQGVGRCVEALVALVGVSCGLDMQHVGIVRVLTCFDDNLDHNGPHLTIEFQASSILNLTNVVNPVNPMPQLPFGNDLCHPPKIGRPL